MPAEILDNLQQALAGEVRRDEPMSRHTTWRVGGPADMFILPADAGDARQALQIVQEAGIPWLVIGSGSNLLVADGGLRGAVLQLGRLRRLRRPAGDTLIAEAGLPLSALVRQAVAWGLQGMEQLAGIPGTVGGAVVMNAGAGGQTIGSTVRALSLSDGRRVIRRPGADLSWSYRESGLPEGWMVLEVEFALQADEPGRLQQLVQERLAVRRRSQGVGAPSAGSVFRNPPGLKAWRLIQQAGMAGARCGAARVSSRHSNFIINEGAARADDILQLIERIRHEVCRQTGVALQPEIRIVGEDGATVAPSAPVTA